MPQGTQPGEVVPLGRTRGALSKEDLAKMQESFNLDTEDTDASDLRERMNKSTKKRKKTATKPPKSKTTKRSTKNLRENSPENEAVVVDDDDVLIQQEDVEDVVQKVPQLVDAFLILRNSQEQLKALQSSATRVDDIPITTNNDNTIVIGFRNKALAAQPVKFKIFRNDTFMKPLENYLKARAPDKTPSQCILKFDGEIIDHNKTPKDIALLDNLDIIDVIFVDTPLQNNNNNNTNPSPDNNNNNTNTNSNIKSSASVVILDDDETPTPRNDLQRAATTHLTVAESAQEKVKIKVRVDGGEVHKFMVSKTDPFGKVIRGLSEKLKCQPTHLKLIFDGMVVKEGSTPEDLDMEDGDLMDATTK